MAAHLYWQHKINDGCYTTIIPVYFFGTSTAVDKVIKQPTWDQYYNAISKLLLDSATIHFFHDVSYFKVTVKKYNLYVHCC
jgi:hypothetical protein